MQDALLTPQETPLMFIQLLFVTNSVVKGRVLALLAFLAAGNVRRFRFIAVPPPM